MRHTSLVERLRAVHLEMVDAVLGGDGLGRVAQLAADAAGGAGGDRRAAPRRGRRVGRRRRATSARSAATSAIASKDRPAPVPPGILAEVPIASGDEVIGAVVLLGEPGGRVARGDGVPAPRRGRLAHRGRGRGGQGGGRAEPARLVPGGAARQAATSSTRTRSSAARRGWAATSRAGRSCCAPSCRPTGRATWWRRSPGEYPGALAQHMELPGDAPRVYALLPAAGGDDAPEATLAAARQLAARLQRHGTVGLSSFYADPAELGRAIQEAELVLDVLRRSDVPIAEDIGTGTYRLLFRVLASHPEEVRSFYEDTVAPIVKYDDQYATDLVGTLEAYLEQNCNMNATAAAIYAHRHTVAYRLERVKELTGPGPDAVRGPRAARAGAEGLPDHRAAAAALTARGTVRRDAASAPSLAGLAAAAALAVRRGAGARRRDRRQRDARPDRPHGREGAQRSAPTGCASGRAGRTSSRRRAVRRAPRRRAQPHASPT